MKAKPTKGEAEYVPSSRSIRKTGSVWVGLERVCSLEPRNEKPNSELITEAFNTYNDTGLTPQGMLRNLKVCSEYESRLKNEKDTLREQNDKMREALEEIQKGEGAYDPDKYEHANNTIENMKSIATEALTK